MLVTLLWGRLAFTVLYAYLLALRMRVGRLETKAMSAAFLPSLPQSHLRSRLMRPAWAPSMDNLGFIVAGYLITIVSLAG